MIDMQVSSCTRYFIHQGLTRLEPTKIEGTVCIPGIAAVRTGVYHPSVNVHVNLAQNDWENDWEMQDRRQFR